MTYLLSTSLPYAFGIAISPIPIIAIVAILSARPANALTFAVGWVLGLVAISLVVLALPGLDSAGNEPSALSGWLRLAVGVLLALLAGYKWSKRKSDAGNPPRILARIDAATARGIFGLGFVLSALNPKAIALTFGGTANIHAYSTGWAQQTTALALFILIASITVIVPIVGHLSFPSRSATMLKHLQAWLIRNNAVLSAAVSGLFGVLLIANGAGIILYAG